MTGNRNSLMLCEVLGTDHRMCANRTGLTSLLLRQPEAPGLAGVRESGQRSQAKPAPQAEGGAPARGTSQPLEAAFLRPASSVHVSRRESFRRASQEPGSVCRL